MSFNVDSGETDRLQTEEQEALKEWAITGFSLVAGLTRSSACFSLLENSLTAQAIEAEKISTLSSHKLNQGSHDSSVHDLATHCYLQGQSRGLGNGHRRKEARRDLLVRLYRALPSFICLCARDIAVRHGCCVKRGDAFAKEEGGGILCVWMFYVSRLPRVEGQTQSIEAINVAWRLEGRQFLRSPYFCLLYNTHTHTHSTVMYLWVESGSVSGVSLHRPQFIQLQLLLLCEEACICLQI